jgi:site-specific recombinase XerD
VQLSRLCFRALIEVLLGTGARISDILSLDRANVLFERHEAKIIGKGNKERIIFFTERSLEGSSHLMWKIENAVSGSLRSVESSPSAASANVRDQP